MKPLPFKIDDYLFERISEEARSKQVTKAEIVRSALVHYLIHREDLADAQAIRERLDEPDIPARRVHLQVATKKRTTTRSHQ